MAGWLSHLLALLGGRRRGSEWVEPGNAITRAIAAGVAPSLPFAVEPEPLLVPESVLPASVRAESPGEAEPGAADAEPAVRRRPRRSRAA